MAFNLANQANRGHQKALNSSPWTFHDSLFWSRTRLAIQISCQRAIGSFVHLSVLACRSLANLLISWADIFNYCSSVVAWLLGCLLAGSPFRNSLCTQSQEGSLVQVLIFESRGAKSAFERPIYAFSPRDWPWHHPTSSELGIHSCKYTEWVNSLRLQVQLSIGNFEISPLQPEGRFGFLRPHTYC